MEFDRGSSKHCSLSVVPRMGTLKLERGINMAKIVIGAERLPTIEILGKDYPYDASSQTVLSRLEELSAGIEPRLDSAIDACKEFVTLLFCGNPEPAARIAEIYKDSALLWIDVVVQLMEHLDPARMVDTVTSRIKALKARAMEK